MVTTPSVVASLVVGTMVWRRRRKLNEQDPRRTRTLADFFDKLVGGAIINACCALSPSDAVCIEGQVAVVTAC